MTKTDEWIEKEIKRVGYFETCRAYSKYLVECVTDRPFNSESYSRQCRRIRAKLEKKTPPQASSDVATVRDAADFHEIDLGRYDIVKGSATTWGNQDNPNKRVKIDFVPRKISQEEILNDFKKAIADFEPPTLPDCAPVSGEYLLEINIPDAHFGQLSWGEETGQGDWDVKIASAEYLATVSRMLEWARSRPVERIIFPVGHDFFNSDNHNNTTTAGTPQTEDSRWMKMFGLGWKLVRDAVIIAAQVAPVDVICVPGNHDTERAFYMAEVLSAWFKNCESVEVDNTPRRYKVREYGKNMILFTHGHGCKPEKLPGIMATDWPEIWGRTKHREAHIGHFHTDNTKEFPGCKVVVVPSIVSASEWTASMGMRSKRGARAFLWHKELGRIETFDYSPSS